MANTVIQLKYSNTTGMPPSLNVAEPAYSKVSNKLWIDDGTGVVAIGGKHYTNIIDAANTAATGNTLVKRDLTGSFDANVITVNTLVANTSVIQNGYDLYEFANNAYKMANNAMIAGGQIAGSYANSAYLHANAAYVSQNTTGVYANTSYLHANAAYVSQNSTGNYANSAYIRANAAYVSQNTTGVYANTAYLHANAAYVSQNTTGVYANAAYAHANTKFASAGGTITGDVVINANLTVSGATTYVNTQTILVSDNILTLNSDVSAGQQPTENAGIEVARGAQPNSSLIWVESAGKWSANNGNTSYYLGSDAAEAYANSAYSHANSAYLQANLAYVSQNSTGNYANSAYAHANSSYLHANAAYTSQNTTGVYANTAYLHANAAYVSQNTTGQYANSAYLRANAAYVSQNSTGNYANTAYAHANAAYNLANTDVTYLSTTAGIFGSASIVPVFNIAANGRVYGVTNTAISINTSQVTTGILPVVRGGTGNNAFTTNHVLIGNGTAAVTTTGSSTEGHVLTISSSGVPTFQHLSGGTF